MKTALENDMLMIIKDYARDAKDDEQMELNQITEGTQQQT